MDITQNPLIHLILFGGSFLAIILCIVLLTRHGNKKGYIIAPLTFFINLFLFNVTIYLRTYYDIVIIDFQGLFDWSSIVRLHAFIIILVSVLIEPARNRYDIPMKQFDEKRGKKT
jgi:hypothetical protein